MSFLNTLEKNIKEWHILTIVGLVILGYVIYDYSSKKNLSISNYQGTNGQHLNPASYTSTGTGVGAGAGAGAGAGVVGFSPDADNLDGPASVSGSASVPKMHGGSMNKELLNPADLLPKDSNNTWSSGLAPDNELKNVNLLTAGHHIGINTVGSSLRNANLQIRSEPPNPRDANISPWNNSTIEPDTSRKPLC